MIMELSYIASIIIRIIFLPEFASIIFLLTCLFHLFTGSKTSRFMLLAAFVILLTSLISHGTY